jgi:hypothetical protein
LQQLSQAGVDPMTLPHEAQECRVFLHSGKTKGSQQTGQKISSRTTNMQMVKQSISSAGMVRVFCLQYGHCIGTDVLQ